MLTCFILERLYLISYIHSSVEKCFVFGEILEASKAIYRSRLVDI